MNKKILTLFLTLFVSSAFAQASLKDNFEFHVTGFNHTTVHAGDSIRFHLQVDVKDWEVLKRFSGVFLMAAGKGLEIIKQGDEKRIQKTDFDIEVKIPENFAGPFPLTIQSLNFFEDCKKGEYCIPDAEFIGLEIGVLEVLNSGVVDVDPPVLTDVEFNRTTIQAGDTFRISIKASDKSPICTGEKEVTKAHGCVEHIVLKGVTDPDSKMQQYPPILVDANHRLYSEFAVPWGTKPGVYRLETFNLYDTWRNQAHEVAESLQREITVVSADTLEDL